MENFEKQEKSDTHYNKCIITFYGKINIAKSLDFGNKSCYNNLGFQICETQVFLP